MARTAGGRRSPRRTIEHQTVSAYLPVDVARDVRLVCAFTGWSPSRLVRQALTKYLPAVKTAVEEEAGRKIFDVDPLKTGTSGTPARAGAEDSSPTDQTGPRA